MTEHSPHPDGPDPDLADPDLAEATETEAPHESETLEEPVLNSEGDVVPVPEHADDAFIETDAEVYGHQTNFGTDADDDTEDPADSDDDTEGPAGSAN